MKSLKRYLEVLIFWLLPVALQVFVAVELVAWLVRRVAAP